MCSVSSRARSAPRRGRPGGSLPRRREPGVSGAPSGTGVVIEIFHQTMFVVEGCYRLGRASSRTRSRMIVRTDCSSVLPVSNTRHGVSPFSGFGTEAVVGM